MSIENGSSRRWTMADLKEFIKYEHHGKMVSVEIDQKGLHRDVCLCYDCAKFNPGVPEKNCPIANLIYAVCIAMDVTTPVWECPKFEQGIPYVSTNELLDVLNTDEEQKAIKELIKSTEKGQKAMQDAGLSETVHPLVEHKKDCASFNMPPAGFASSVNDCDCGAIIKTQDDTRKT